MADPQDFALVFLATEGPPNRGFAVGAAGPWCWVQMVLSEDQTANRPSAELVDLPEIAIRFENGKFAIVVFGAKAVAAARCLSHPAV